MIRLFVGLGNPGPEYEDTRHNAGFWWIDALARGLKATPQLDVKYHGLVARVNDAPGAAGPIWLLQPMTYMNLSGKSVAALARFFKIAPEEILAIHDELELAPGELKLKQGGGNAGHNGLKDMQAQLGSGNFWRLRLGIGHPGHRDEVAGYVLRKPPLAERQAVEDCIGKSLESFKLMAGGDMPKAVAQLHAKPPRPKPPRPAHLPPAGERPRDKPAGTGVAPLPASTAPATAPVAASPAPAATPPGTEPPPPTGA
ncbi:aminoacyl-tRNA hydrolase [Roseateles aquatilis]|uniref:Peptidyl-tRNA hydrolase n=1 Tax=Roseateles aquatilis TaxID=431061 RepID=A0A246JML6_9BURK|nr:aminoacyl-tRNA hydrolase [Roseateles aquatilis]OWQ93857.1 aminoacyl-tRNA hydrolase [Roseateles aquatilis]